jgi:hypothetical protein
MPTLRRVAEVRPPQPNTTTQNTASMTLPVAGCDFKSIKRIDMPTSASSRSRPAHACKVLKHPCPVSRCGGTPSRVPDNLDSPPRPTSKGPEHVGRRHLKYTQRMDKPSAALSRSHPAHAFGLLKHACSLSGSGGTPSRVPHNHSLHYFHDSTCRKTGFQNYQAH